MAKMKTFIAIPHVKDFGTTVEYEMREIFLCKDCKYGQKCVDGRTFQCFKWNSGEFGELHEENWFCADGVMK